MYQPEDCTHFVILDKQTHRFMRKKIRGICQSTPDSRYQYNVAEEGVTFIPFPKTKQYTQVDLCLPQWEVAYNKTQYLKQCTCTIPDIGL